jgi:cell wall-associated NlpC family hydrolase
VIFFHDSTGYVYPDGIDAGNNTIIVAPHTGAVVEREALRTSTYYVGRFTASR